MKKAFDQTVRDLKREVNKKVLNVPGIEQKVLDSTSNEPWGPHGSHLADIAEATRNYHEYQIIMVVLWKRINDIGKNWRHVYKALTVLEYLVGHGSERVIDEIREHAYQISTLSHFQYIDSRGRDQGNNVRKKSQTLVSLVNDKERIVEVRQKAAANRDKFRSTSATGGMYRLSSYSSTRGYGDRNDDRFGGGYGYRDDDRNGYGREREREWKYSDDDRYGRDGDRYGREYDERYRKDGFRDDEYRGRSQSNDDYQYMTRSRSSDRDRAYEDDGRYSSRSNGAKADHSPDEKHLERKFSEQNIGAPPSYEDTINDARSPVQDESGRDGETKHAPVPKASSPPGNTSQSQVTTVLDAIASPANQGVEAFHGFDPRSSVSASSAAPETDLIGSFSDSFSSNSLALVPVSSAVSASESNAPINSSSGPTFAAFSSAPTVLNQPIENPFGDSPFNATPLQATLHAQPHNFDPTTTSHSTMNPISEPVTPPTPISTTFDFGDTFQGITYTPPNIQIPSTNPQNSVPPPQPRSDALGNFLPQLGPTAPVPSQPNNIFAQTAESLPPTMEPAGAGQCPKDKFEPKSTVWADTLSRGLVNLNISGSKINPLADIGVDFESINRKEKREKPVTTSVTSSIAMGKAMGSGSGIGRAGASAIRPSSNSMMGMGMGMNGPGMGIGMRGYGAGVSQPMGMGMGQGIQMRPPAGLPLGSTMPGGYNPMMSMGSYAPQQPYSGYR